MVTLGLVAAVETLQVVVEQVMFGFVCGKFKVAVKGVLSGGRILQLFDHPFTHILHYLINRPLFLRTTQVIVDHVTFDQPVIITSGVNDKRVCAQVTLDQLTLHRFLHIFQLEAKVDAKKVILFFFHLIAQLNFHCLLVLLHSCWFLSALFLRILGQIGIVSGLTEPKAQIGVGFVSGLFFSAREVVDLLILLHANDVVFVGVASGSDKAEPVAVAGIAGVYVEEGHLARGQNCPHIVGVGAVSD
ncbi:hypothetical protein BpHYR1_029091 [Brachionus plicatilis]|uniref:Uncharacterized protein n=1 Tax=Brachionus plicatilis TaxID=10195 RepID=A0A3M7Q4Q3_BRAPC|nr:hypothetical protein BpHYR1_029091 [Brachionus plicatilis]